MNANDSLTSLQCIFAQLYNLTQAIVFFQWLRFQNWCEIYLTELQPNQHIKLSWHYFSCAYESFSPLVDFHSPPPKMMQFEQKFCVYLLNTGLVFTFSLLGLISIKGDVEGFLNIKIIHMYVGNVNKIQFLVRWCLINILNNFFDLLRI